MAREYHYTPDQIDLLTDEEISWLCKSDKDAEAERYVVNTKKGGEDFGGSYQAQYIWVWHKQRGLPMEQVKAKWEKERGTGWVPNVPWQDVMTPTKPPGSPD